MKTQTTETNTPLRGDALLVDVINHILAHPETWKQSAWHCGTSHCFFGHAQIRGGRCESNDAFNDGMELLGLSEANARWLSLPNRTLPELYVFVKERINRAGYNRDGYNRAGYNRDGYNRDGYNRAGYNRAGYNRDGYDRDGYNRAGYNRDGYNRAGYNRAGYDRDGQKLALVPLTLPNDTEEATQV